VEARCRRNLAPYGDRVRVIKARAAGALDELYAERRLFDVVYLDAGKRPGGVMARSVLAWSLLRHDGIFIWDDLTWGAGRPELERPALGIKVFCNAFGSCMTILHRQSQLIVRKTAEWPGLS